MTSISPYDPVSSADGCELCEATSHSPHLRGVRDYITGETFDLVRGAQCGLVSTRPAPTDLSKYYPPRYRVDRQKQTGAWRVRRRATMLARHFPESFCGRLLDLGCGSGAFALEMKRRGWTVAVTELDETVLARMRAQHIEAKRPDEALRDGFSQRFDAITCWHVLEHVPHPLALVLWSGRLLNGGGVFQVTVPNLASWQAKYFGRHWLHLDVPRHLYHFTPATLGTLLDKAGMMVVAESTLAIEYDVFGVMQSALNAICSNPNVLFERLSARGEAPAASRADLTLSYLLAAPLAMFGTVHSLVATVFGAGATLTASCRRCMMAGTKPERTPQ
ncbi:MAG: class I SAM-dependent methyltransferase [Acidobacteriota bacterium]